MACILGIDPGSVITGYAVIQANKSLELQLLGMGCIKLGKLELSAKLAKIYTTISELVIEHKPDTMAIEQVFVGCNVQSALKLGQARGVALAACGSFALECFEYSPRSIKQAIVGYGAAEKSQVQLMLRQLLGIKGKLQADAADAAAVAICHAQQLRVRQKIQEKL